MTENDIITHILDEAFYIHRSIGPGMLESVYKTCLAYRLRQKGLLVEVEKAVPLVFEEVKLDCGYRADLVINNKVIIEAKTIESFADIHTAQILTYLRLLNLRYGLLLNFNTVHLKTGIKRVLNGF